MNRALRDLIIAILGSAEDGSRIRGPTLVDHFQMVQLISKCFQTRISMFWLNIFITKDISFGFIMVLIKFDVMHR